GARCGSSRGAQPTERAHRAASAERGGCSQPDRPPRAHRRAPRPFCAGAPVPFHDAPGRCTMRVVTWRASHGTDASRTAGAVGQVLHTAGAVPGRPQFRGVAAPGPTIAEHPRPMSAPRPRLILARDAGPIVELDGRRPSDVPTLHRVRRGAYVDEAAWR